MIISATILRRSSAEQRNTVTGEMQILRFIFYKLTLLSTASLFLIRVQFVSGDLTLHIPRLTLLHGDGSSCDRGLTASSVTPIFGQVAQPTLAGAYHHMQQEQHISAETRIGLEDLADILTSSHRSARLKLVASVSAGMCYN